VKTVLVVDDSKTIRTVVTRLLIERLGEGIQVIEAVDGEDALGVLGATDVDLVLLDWNMPVLDGHETLKRIRNDLKDASLKVMMLTTEARKENVRQVKELGICGYIAKPFNHDRLVEQVVRNLGR